MKKVRRFMINALIMAAAAVLMRTIGVSYNVWLSNRIGAECIGLYSLVMSVYSFGITLASSGVNLAAVRLTAENLPSDNANHRKSGVMSRCIIYACLFGFGAGILFFLSADFISLNILHDGRTLRSLHALSFSLPVISVSSALSGYFNGVRRVYKNAAAQIAGQPVQIAIVSAFVMRALPEGIESACYAVVAGGVISDIISFLFSLVMYISDRFIHREDSVSVSGKRAGLKDVAGIALPTAVGAYARSALLTIEHIAIPRGLKKCGSSPETALASYGVVHGMVFPMILFPSAVLGAFAGLLIPEIAESRTNGNEKRIRYIAGRVFSVSLIFSVGVSAVFIGFGTELSGILFSGSGSESEAARYIMLVSPLIPVMYLDGAVDAMLKGMGQQLHSMKINIADAAVSVILVLILVPEFGIYGYIITVFVCEVMNGALSIIRLLKVISFRARPFEWFIKPVICAFCAVGGSRLLMMIAGGGFIMWIVIASAVYLMLVIFCDVISKNDIKWAAGIFKKENGVTEKK